MSAFNIFLVVMSAVAVVVFVALYFVRAGYGVFASKKWGKALPNRIGWFLMESPVFLAMLLLWIFSSTQSWTTLVFLLIFEMHYFQRSFIFPLLLKGNGVMPISVMLMGIVFNSCNAFMQGGWLFYWAPDGRYPLEWLWSPQFICGLCVFFIGMYINLDSDRRIRALRKDGDNKHYMPVGGMFEYVSSANYFGELLEWIGYAILTWSWAGVVFAVWTFANLTPRAAAINKKYAEMFGEAFTQRHVKRIIPFIY